VGAFPKELNTGLLIQGAVLPDATGTCASSGSEASNRGDASWNMLGRAKHEEADCFAVGRVGDAVREPRAVRAEVRWVIHENQVQLRQAVGRKQRQRDHHPTPSACSARMQRCPAAVRNDWASADRADYAKHGVLQGETVNSKDTTGTLAGTELERKKGPPRRGPWELLRHLSVASDSTLANPPASLAPALWSCQRFGRIGFAVPVDAGAGTPDCAFVNVNHRLWSRLPPRPTIPPALRPGLRRVHEHTEPLSSHT